MFSLPAVFLCIALFLGILGFGGAGAGAQFAKILFILFTVLFLASAFAKKIPAEWLR